MRQHSKHTRLLAVFLGFSLLAAACGDDEEEPEAGDETEEEEADPVEVLQEVGEADPSCQGDEDGTLAVGELLPETGNLAFLGPPMTTGGQLAVEEVNSNGGVNGQQIVYHPGDSGGSGDNISPGTVDRHLAANPPADIILGAASSGVSFDVIDTIVDACKIMFSPANTAPDFITYEEDDLYFRTAPADILQGQVLAELALEDGVQTAAILNIQDAYGEGLARYITEPFEAGNGEIVVSRPYDPEAGDFSAEVQEVVDADPDALFMVGFAESAQIMQDLFEAGYTLEAGKFIYLVDGNIGNALAEEFGDATQLADIRGTFPAAENPQQFRDRMTQHTAGLTDYHYGPETYDAVIITALAAIQAGTDRPDEVARYINGITRDGTVCESFTDCRTRLEAGEDIDYNGPSGPLTFARVGEPISASIEIQKYGPNGQIDNSLSEWRDVELPM